MTDYIQNKADDSEWYRQGIPITRYRLSLARRLHEYNKA